MAQRMHEPAEVAGLPHGSLEDKALTLAFQAGDRRAYQVIHDRYGARVDSVCRRMLGNPHDAQEAAQESFLRVYQALDRFNGRYQLGAWITRIATNVCLDHIRSRCRRPVDPVDLQVLDVDDDRYHDLEDPETITIRRAEGRRVRRVLESLPPMHRAAIVLRDFEGLSYEEVAIALQITESQVKALIHRARQGFKRSWTSIAVTVFLPERLLQRVRKLHAPKTETTQSPSIHQVAESIGASAAPAASSCSSVLSHCGQFVADKFAPAVTAVALAATGFAGAGAHQNADAAAKPRVTEVARDDRAAVELELVRRQLGISATPRTPTKTNETAVRTAPSEDPPSAEERETSVAPVTQPPASPAPAASPSPAATPQPTPSSSPAQKSEQPTGEQPTGEQPAPAPPTIGVVLSSTTGSSRIADSMSTSFRCTYFSLTQSISSSVSRESSSWPLRLALSAGQTEMALEVGVMVSGREVIFETDGGLTALKREGDRASVQFAGTYRTGNKEAEDVLGVPMAGTFQLDLTLDCASRSVIAESLAFEA